MQAITFALVAYLFWGVGDLFTTVAARRFSAFPAAFWSSIISIVLLTFMALGFTKDLSLITPETFFLTG